MLLENEETHDYGFDFRVRVEHDESKQCVLLSDMWGFFLPIPISLWDQVVNKIYLPRLMKELSPLGMPYPLIYQAAVQRYCRTYHFCYIGQN